MEVILETREGKDRTTERNRHTGKILSDGGVEVIYDPLFKTMHAKALVADGEWILIGSTNWVFSSLTNNNEVSVLIKSKEVAKTLIDYFNLIKATGTKHRRTGDQAIRTPGEQAEYIRCFDRITWYTDILLPNHDAHRFSCSS